MPVLYGVFLYMGVTSLGGVQVRQLDLYISVYASPVDRKPVIIFAIVNFGVPG